MTEDTTNPAGEVETTPAETTGNEHPDEQGAESKPRDEKGRFTKAEDAGEEALDPDAALEALQEGEEQADEEMEEIDWDGKRYALPKAIKEAVMRQADYTRKTQEVANMRKALEATLAEQKQNVEHQQAEFEEHAALHALRKYVDNFSSIDWNKAMEEDPILASKQFMEWQTLRTQLQDREGKLRQKQEERALQTQREAAKRMEEGHEALRQTIKGWSPETERNLKAYAKETGVPNADNLQFGMHPQETRILHKAYLYDQLMKKAQSKPKAPDPKPVKTVGQGRSASPQGLSDDLSMEEWANRRRAQVLRGS